MKPCDELDTNMIPDIFCNENQYLFQEKGP